MDSVSVPQHREKLTRRPSTLTNGKPRMGSRQYNLAGEKPTPTADTMRVVFKNDYRGDFQRVHLGYKNNKADNSEEAYEENEVERQELLKSSAASPKLKPPKGQMGESTHQVLLYVHQHRTAGWPCNLDTFSNQNDSTRMYECIWTRYMGIDTWKSGIFAILGCSLVCLRSV